MMHKTPQSNIGTEFIIQDLPKPDLPHGSIYIHSGTMEHFSLHDGDVVELYRNPTHRTTAGKVFTTNSRPGTGQYVYIGWSLRRNLLATKGDRVSLRKIESQPAILLELMPIDKPRPFKNVQALRDKFLTLVMTIGDLFNFAYKGRMFMVGIKGFEPECPAVYVTEHTRILYRTR